MNIVGRIVAFIVVLIGAVIVAPPPVSGRANYFQKCFATAWHDLDYYLTWVT